MNADSGFFDPLASAQDAPQIDSSAAAEPSRQKKEKPPREPKITFLTPSQIVAYETPPNHFLVGDSLVQRGAMTIFAGPGGCGKSRAIFQLAVAAARGEADWMGFPIHFPFKTLVVQSENGLTRLSKDFRNLGDSVGLEGKLLVSSPPKALLAMKDPLFRADLTAAAQNFGPDLIVMDPLNAMISDSQERDIHELHAYLQDIVANVGTNPALMVVHHLRKPREGDKHRGRAMANLLAGSYVITSSARAVLTLQPATDGEDDPHVVLTVAKCNDGLMPPRSAWIRGDGGFFSAATDFDWSAFDGQSGPVAKIREEHLFEIFENGRRALTQATAAKRLMEIAECGRSAAYGALDLQKGRFTKLLDPDLESGVIRLSPFGEKRAREFSEED